MNGLIVYRFARRSLLGILASDKPNFTTKRPFGGLDGLMMLLGQTSVRFRSMYYALVVYIMRKKWSLTAVRSGWGLSVHWTDSVSSKVY